METIIEEGELPHTKNEAQELFKLCDMDSKGYVTSDDLKHISEDLQLTSEQIEMVFQQLDKDENGFLTIEEFEKGLALFPNLPEDCQSTIEILNDFNESDHNSLVTASTECYEGVSNLSEAITLQSPYLEIAGLLQDKVASQLLSQIKTEYPELLPIFEEFIQNLSLKYQQIKEETAILQQRFTRQSVEYQQQIHVLYEEMEQQIQDEKKLITEKKNELERQLRQELEVAVETKDVDIQELLEKYIQTTKELEVASEIKTVTQNENQKLLQEKEMLQQQLDDYKLQLNELHQKLDETKVSNVKEKHNQCRSVNRRLQDKEDELENASFLRTKSINDIPILSNGEHPVQLESSEDKRGSIMSDYVGIHNSSPEEEVNNNKDEFFRCQPQLSMQEPTVNIITTYAKLQSTNPFWSELHNYNEISLPTNSSVKFSSTNPFSRHFQMREELSSSYTSYTDPELDSLEHIFSEKNPDKKQLDLNDCKSPVLCFVHPNNHQTNGFCDQQSSMMASTSFPPESPELVSDDDLIKFEEVSNAIEPRKNQLEPPFSPEPKITSVTMNAANIDPSQLPQTVFKVVFIGDSGVGKTSLINRICGGEFSDKFCTTIGVDFRIKTILLEDHQVVLQLWDTAGQERFRSITSQYLRKSDGVLIVYDVNSEFSFCNVCGWIASLEKVNNDNVVVALIGNKLDLSVSCGKKVVCSDEGRNVAMEKDALFFETSAKDGTGIDELMLTMARKLQKKQMDDIENCVNLTEKPPEASLLSKRRCC